jgi:predicted MFS family arabinose efflux permease
MLSLLMLGPLLVALASEFHTSVAVVGQLAAATAALAFGVAGLTRISNVVTPILLLERAGSSRTTATGLFTLSSQLGGLGGPALGGLMLALGGFPRVGLFCLGVSVTAAVVLHCKVRDSAKFLAQTALQQGTTATE